MRRLSAPLLVLSLCAAPTLAEEPPPKAPHCLSTSDIENLEVVDDYTILFHMVGGKVWKNTMADRCYGLGFERAVTYEVYGGELCGTTQIIHVMRRGSTCVLGPFEAFSPPPKNAEPAHSP